MFSVHYKFKATLEYKTLTFDGLHIGVDELKKAICDKENIRTESFDLLLTNAHTKREYAVGELVPRNSSVVVQRIPRENAQKLPKVQDTSTSGIISRNVGNSLYQQNTYINPEEFAGMSEEQRIAHIKRVSTEKYSSSNYQRRTGGIMTGPPPATYVCNRCGQPGHWYKSCPLLNVRRTAGITMDELMETDRNDPLAMIHPSGKFVKPIMHHQARMQRKYEPFPGQPDEGRSPGQQQSSAATVSAVPEQFRCRLCGGILRDAVLSACCGHSFCAECYQQQLLTHPTQLCPGADCVQQISADSLVPNKMLRDAVQKYLILGIGALEQPPTMLTTTMVPALSVTGGTTTANAAASMAQEHSVTGANKPSVLTDTHSLLHKLLPGLAAAQAQRELDTTVRPSTATTAEATPMTFQSTTLMGDISNGRSASAATDEAALARVAPTTTVAGTLQGDPQFLQQQQQFSSAAVLPPSSNSVPPPQFAAMFDPNKPPPSLTAGMVQPSSVSATAGCVAATPPTTVVMTGVTASGAISSLYTAGAAQPSMFPSASAASMVPTSTMALSAEDSLSVWESFLKRKENEKAERNLQLMRNSGSSNIYQQQQRSVASTAGTNFLYEAGGRDQQPQHSAYGRDGGDRNDRREQRDHHRDHYHHYHHRSSRGGGAQQRQEKEEESEGGGAGKHKQSKMTTEEMGSVWRLFEKHNEEKKETGGKRKEQEDERKKEEEGKVSAQKREEGDGKESARKREEEGREEEQKREEEGKEEVRKREAKVSERKREEAARDEERRKEESGKEEERRRDEKESERKREEATREGELRKEEEERKRTDKEKESERKRKEKGKESERKREEAAREGERRKEESAKEKDKVSERKREEKEKEEEHKGKESERKREGERKKEESGKEREKDEERRKKGKESERKREETATRKGERRKEESAKEEEREREYKRRESERKEEEVATEGERRKEESGKEKEKESEWRKEEKEKEEGRKKKDKAKERERKREEAAARKGEQKKEESGKEKQKLFASPTAAVNQLDIISAQEEPFGWRTGRLRHAPPHSPPNFEDTSRWRPVPEVQVRTESPAATAGDELFIDMVADRRKMGQQEEGGKERESERKREEKEREEEKKLRNGDHEEEKAKKKRSKKEKSSHKRRHRSSETSARTAEDADRGSKKRKRHKKEKKSKRRRKEKSD